MFERLGVGDVIKVLPREQKNQPGCDSDAPADNSEAAEPKAERTQYIQE
jgi:hypothetical protein